MNRDMTLRHIAVHEAGHAVACARLGLGYHAVTTREDSGFDSVPVHKRFEHGCLDRAHPEEFIQRLAIAYAAGYAACLALGYTEEKACEGKAEDFARIWRLKILFGTPLDVPAITAKAIELMSARENEEAVRNLADTIPQGQLPGSLSADAVKMRIELSDALLAPYLSEGQKKKPYTVDGYYSSSPVTQRVEAYDAYDATQRAARLGVSNGEVRPDGQLERTPPLSGVDEVGMLLITWGIGIIGGGIGAVVLGLLYSDGLLRTGLWLTLAGVAMISVVFVGALTIGTNRRN